LKSGGHAARRQQPIPVVIASLMMISLTLPL
jgi:hypothetical protein